MRLTCASVIYVAAVGSLLAGCHRNLGPADSDKVAVYVGVGQVVNTQDGERLSYDYVLSEARRRGDTMGLAALTKLGPLPYGQAQIDAQRVWLERYGGGVVHRPTSQYAMLWDQLQEPEVTLYDLLMLSPGTNFSHDALVDENARIDWITRATQFSMPVFIVSGRYDHMTDGQLAESYFDRIQAPQKRFKWFEHSAHSPMFEEANEFNDFVIHTVRPVAIREIVQSGR